ncbi:MAG TPA: preprotein translocase subunit SecY [Candidatus Saccharimonadales bacterium]|nr:preprotein translocase subunit SecY [Candidatus Saccharimonadales bacterium]
MLEFLRTIWKSRDLRGKILFTLAVFILIRLLAHIPLPQIDKSQLNNFLNQSQNQVFGVLSLFTGGSLSKLSIDLMGVGPYITASIVVQLLTKAIPTWDNLSKEGTAGQEKLNQYTRYLTVPLAIVQGYGTIALLKSQNVLTLATTSDIIKILITVTAVSIFVMWLGELISERGIGNGISLIIGLGIVTGLPQQISNTAAALQGGSITPAIILIALLLLTIIVIVVVNEAERKIPITYSRRAVGSSNTVDSYLPIRVNTAGVIPIIFALSFLTFPVIIARFFTTAHSAWVVHLANKISSFNSNTWPYGVTYFLLVFIFTFFYTYIVFQPDQIAENLQKQASFIPGVRPGQETTKFLRYIITRVTTIGAFFLGVIAILPLIIQQGINLPTVVLGGTSILILVSVVIDTSRQLMSQIVMRRYDTL